MLPEPRHPQSHNALKFDPAFCQTVRELAQEGLFPEEWCAHIGITLATLYRWANKYPEFDEACNIAWYLCRAFWTKQARTARPPQFGGMPATVLVEILRKRFPDTYGPNPKLTHGHFESRNDPDPDASGAGGALENKTDEEIEEVIADYERRHALRDDGI